MNSLTVIIRIHFLRLLEISLSEFDVVESKEKWYMIMAEICMQRNRQMKIDDSDRESCN